MCYFLTVAVPAKHADFLERLFQPEFQTLALTNPHAANAFPPDFVPRVITSGFCSCDLFASPGRTQTDDFTAQLRLKYQREGWSEAKIHRSIEQAEASRARWPRLERGLRIDVGRSPSQAGENCRRGGRLLPLVCRGRGERDFETPATAELRSG
jgi:hypothetical protein